MPDIRPMTAVVYAREQTQAGAEGDISALIAPPYDVLDEGPKRELLNQDAHNIVAIDLPYTPPKVVGPDAVYHQAGDAYRHWLATGVLVRRDKPAVYVYQQTYAHAGQTYHRRGFFARLRVQPFGPSPAGPWTKPGAPTGGIWPHEQTFASGKEDRLKLIRATGAQLSPIFGIYRDPRHEIGRVLQEVVENRQRTAFGKTATDGVLHSLWEVADAPTIQRILGPAGQRDIYIADGHHRYHTAMNYRAELPADLPPDHPANFCMFVCVAMEDPGMIVLPTHRVLGGLHHFTLDALAQAAAGSLKITPFAGADLAALTHQLPHAGPHAVGLVTRSGAGLKLAIATTIHADPLAATHGARAQAWRQLDVAIVQHLLIEELCQKRFGQAGAAVKWKFPHELAQVAELLAEDEFQLGILLQPTPVQAVMDVSDAGELMPQKSTFFYPKLATGLLINPLA